MIDSLVSGNENVERFNGIADVYDDNRPRPPSILLDLLPMYARAQPPRLVVDIGSGTGLSTRFWTSHATEVIGIEPNDDMRALARSRTQAPNVSFRKGDSTNTGLPDACADIVTVSQALHWMDPEPTFTEVTRILRTGGVFAAYDCDFPPMMNPDSEMADIRFMSQAGEIGTAHGYSELLKKLRKTEHLARMESSGRFRYVKEIAVHSAEMGNAERMVGIALSQSVIHNLLKRGLTEEEIGLDEFRRLAQQTMGDKPVPWYFTFRVRLGVK